MKMIIFTILAYFLATPTFFECKSNPLPESQFNYLGSILKKNNDEKLESFLSMTSRNNNLSKPDSQSLRDLMNNSNEFLNSHIRIPHKRTRNIKKFRALTHNGYSLDMNVENFKSLVIF